MCAEVLWPVSAKCVNSPEQRSCTTGPEELLGWFRLAQIVVQLASLVAFTETLECGEEPNGAIHRDVIRNTAEV